MHYFARIGDVLVFRLINYGILMHAFICIGAMGMVLAAPLLVSDLFDDIKLTNEVMTEAQVVSAPLVNRSEERGDARTGKFLYYVELPNQESGREDSMIRFAAPYLRSTPVGDLETLQIFSHPRLTGPSNVFPRIIEVPSGRSWTSVFQAIRGRSITAAIALLLSQIALGISLVYVSIRGYFFIKYGARRRKR